MLNQFSRTKMLIGEEGIRKLREATVAIFGIGGVGSYVVEALARAGVGNLVLIDKDDISITNVNRQIHSLMSTIGKSKVDVMKERILDINPNASVRTFNEFYAPDSSLKMLDKNYSYVVDAIDTISSKIDLIVKSKQYNIPIISAMGAANKLDPTKFEVVDIYNTSVCPLAKIIRKELRNRGIDKLKVVYSKEEPIKRVDDKIADSTENNVPGSISFVPSVMGLIIAGEVVNDLIRRESNE